MISPSQSTNIWLDDKSQNSLLNPTNGTHNRAVSSNSQIWRNDATSLNGGGGSNPIRGFDFGGYLHKAMVIFHHLVTILVSTTH